MAGNKSTALADKVVLITGASRGIGAATATRLAGAGATIVINFLQSRERALEVLEEVEKAGGKGMTFQADVTERKSVDEMAHAVEERFGGVDVLVNNAFFPFEVGPLHQISWQGLQEAASRELAALYHCVQAFVPGMIEKKRGKIIVVSSRVAQQPLPRLGAHSIGKAALEAMANTMAIELGPYGITVNVVSPAFTLTEASAIMSEEFKERVLKSRPLARHIYPEDVAGTIAFLAGDDANLLTGTHILVTAGSHLQF